MEVKLKNFVLKIDWKSIVGVSSAIGVTVLLNTLSARGQLKSFELDLNNKKLCLNS